MKIEKISENQIKFVLTHNDLMQRNIQLRELAYGSAKAQNLFKEIMERAAVECDFHMSPDTPLVIEAIPVDKNGMTVVVTKVSNPANAENGFSHLFGGLSQIPQALFPKLPFNIPGFPGHAHHPVQAHPAAQPAAATQPKRQENNANSIFIFNSIDDVAKAVKRVFPVLCHSSLYKYNGEFYLVIRNDNKNKLEASQEPLLTEHGRKFSNSELSSLYLLEHGEVLIKSDAVNVLTTYLA